MDGKKKMNKRARRADVTTKYNGNSSSKKGKKVKSEAKTQVLHTFKAKKKKIKFINSHIEHLSHRLTHRWIFMAHKQIGIPIEALSWDINTTRIPLCSHCLPACRSRFFPLTSHRPSSDDFLTVVLLLLALHILHCRWGDLRTHWTTLWHKHVTTTIVSINWCVLLARSPPNTDDVLRAMPISNFNPNLSLARYVRHPEVLMLHWTFLLSLRILILISCVLKSFWSVQSNSRIHRSHCQFL